MRSMTAFGRAVTVLSDREVTVELRSVNNRYLDWNIRLPRAYLPLEDRIKTTLGAKGITRGKVDVTVSVNDAPRAAGKTSCGNLVADMDAARAYVNAAEKISAELGIPNDLTTSRLLTLHGVMVTEEVQETFDEDAAWEMILPVLSDAADVFMAARVREGERLSADLSAKLSGIREMTAGLAAMSEQNITQYRERFEERLRGILGDNGFTPDENRIITECAVYADRVAIDEELVRLASHFDALDGLFASPEPVGRRIDFMLQETNREVNTIGSKCSDAAMAHVVADIKSELEKIREQIQNIE